ncbi:MAG TPA: hypothetical protein VIJ52_00775 [Pseudolabrys sp.]
MTAFVVIALAVCLFGLVFVGRVQILIAPIPRPVIEPWGTNDPAASAKELPAP